jgi:hypothetical protein
MGLEHDRCEDLDPVGHQLAVTRHARLAGLGISAQAPRSLALHQRRLAMGRPNPHRHHLGDPSRDELVVARGVRPLVQPHRALAGLAGVVPRLLAGKQLGEAMRWIAIRGHAAVELAAVARLAVVAIEADPRPHTLRSRTHGHCLTPRLARRRHLGDQARPRADRTLS